MPTTPYRSIEIGDDFVPHGGHNRGKNYAILSFAISLILIISAAASGDIYATQDACFIEPFKTTGTCAIKTRSSSPSVLWFEGCYLGGCRFNANDTTQNVCLVEMQYCQEYKTVAFERDFKNNQTKMEHYQSEYNGFVDCMTPELSGGDTDEKYACFEKEATDLRARNTFFVGVLIISVMFIIGCSAVCATILGCCVSD